MTRKDVEVYNLAFDKNGIFCRIIIKAFNYPNITYLTMKNNLSQPSGKRNAFALILAIGAMAFMVLLVLTLSSVVSAKMRLLNAQKENRMARSNALLGMSVAVSELQRSLGPDNAISAPSTIFDIDPSTVQVDGVRTPFVVGAFPVEKDKRSMTFLEAQQSERYLPDLLKEGKTVDSSEVSWLISSERRMLNPAIQSPADLSEETVKLASYSSLTDFPTSMGGKVMSSLKSETVDVEAGKVNLEQGAYAWWVSDESLKAKINMARPEKYLDGKSMDNATNFKAPADRLLPQVSYTSFIDEFGSFQLNPFMSAFDEEKSKTLKKATSFDEVAMLDSSLTEWVQKNKNDYTVSSMGLPVDVSQGRLKQDMSVYLTKSGQNKGLKDEESIIRGSNDDNLYTGPKFELETYDKNIPRMGLLRDWATMFDTTGKTFKDGIEARAQKTEKSDVQHGLYPIVSQVSWTFRLAYSTSGTLGNDSTVRLYLVFYPRVVLWNPHHVTIKESDYLLRIFLPYALELGTFGEGYFEVDRAKVENYVTPLALRYEPVRIKETNDVDSKERIFHPYRIYKYAGSGSAAQGVNAPKTYNKSMAVSFRKILQGRSLNRGTASHATDKSSTVKGTPVMSMRVDSLELKPGETVQLIAYDDSSTMQVYRPTSSVEVIPSRGSSSYPRLMPAKMVQSGNTFTRGAGVLIDTGLDFSEADNLIDVSRWDKKISQELKDAVKPKGNTNNPQVVGHWRVVPLLSDGKIFSFTSDSTDAKQGNSFLGYELWTKSSSSYEYLTGLDTAMLASTSKTTSAGQSNLQKVWNYARDIAFQPLFGQITIFSNTPPMRFAISYNWNNRIDNKGLSYLNPDRDLSVHFGFMGNGDKLGNGSLNGDYYSSSRYPRLDFAMTNPNAMHYLTPAIPNISTIQSLPWKAEFTDANVPVVPNSDASGHLDIGARRAGNDSSTYNSVAYTNAQRSWALYGGAYGCWSRPTLGPSKDSAYANGDAGAGMPYMPPYMALMNPLRDNGNVPRVDSWHSYNLMPYDFTADGYGSRSEWKNYIFTETDMSQWDIHSISETSSAQYIDQEGDWAYVQNYPSDGGYRMGAPALFFPLSRLWHGGCGFFSAKAFEKRPTSLVMPVFDFVRNSEEVMSLGVFSNANLSTMLWQPQRALGESWASPFIKREEIVNTEDKKLHQNELIDISYMLNASIWDRFYLSTIPQDGLNEIYAGMRMRNTRNVLTSVPENKSELYATKDAFEKSASHIAVEGAFNVNSTSYEAWRAFLGGMFGVKKKSLLEDEYPKSSDPSSPTKFYMPNPGNLNTVINPQPAEKKVGYRDAGAGRDISEAEIDELAREIVGEVKRRAPFFSLADFVNRRLIKYSDASGDVDLSYQSLMGTLAAAIARTSEQQIASKPTVFNADYDFTKKSPTYQNLMRMMRDTSKESIEQASMAPTGKYYRRGAGLAGFQLMQSQLLTAYAPFMTVRGDTFTVRAYGEYKNPMTGTSAKAYCEALVQRSSETVEASDDIVAPTGPFGRKFKIVSFRWLTPAEL